MSKVGGLADEWLRMYDERMRMTPRTGYNVLVLSEYNPRRHGENRLRLVRHVETWEEAQSVKKEMIEILGQSNAEDLLIYPMRKRETKSTESEDVKKKDEFNPFHDELGRFTDADGSSTISFGDRDSPMTRALKADISARSAIVERIASNFVTRAGDNFYAIEDSQKYAGQIESIKQAMMVMGERDLSRLEKAKVMIDTDYNERGTIRTPGLSGSRAGAFYLPDTRNNRDNLSFLNNVMNTDYQTGQIVISAGYDDDVTYGTMIHEIHHAKWDSINLDFRDTSVSVDDLDARTVARGSFNSNYEKVMSTTDGQVAFAAAFGSYGTKFTGDLVGRDGDSNRQEGFTTLAEAYYATPNFRFSTDRDSGSTALKGATNEHYFDTVRKAFPELGPLMESWENLSAATFGEKV